MTNKSIAIIAFLGLFVVLFCFKQCHNIYKEGRQNYITDSTAHVSKYKKSVLEKEVNIIRDTEYIYLDRWHDSKVIVKTIFKEVYRDAPDTCKGYVAKIELAVQGEQKAAQLVHETDSLIIANLDAVVKVDSLLIAKAKQDLKATQDTLSKNRKRQPIRNFFAICKGVVSGAVVVEVINKIK